MFLHRNGMLTVIRFKNVHPLGHVSIMSKHTRRHQVLIGAFCFSQHALNGGAN